MNKFKFLFVYYTLILLALFLYSFTQIDLSLTFSRITLLRNIVKGFQYIGYFNRPLSTYMYAAILILLTVFQLKFLYLAHIRKLSLKEVWKLIIAAAILLTLAYNAFSYDIFNYMFDAKIITHYYQNPYYHTALDYPGDPMLSFMHWTQRTFPYGPAWLVLTVPLSFIGFGFFLPTFFFFKILAAASYLGCLYFIGKIIRETKPDMEVFGLVFFGLQPLILIESLVSGHIDITMMFFATWAMYLYVRKKFMVSLLILLFSIGIKFATALLLPIYLLPIVIKNSKVKLRPKMSVLGLIFMLISVIIASNRTTFQPWYLIEGLCFAVFLSDNFYILIPSIIVSFFAMFTYIPFLYTGNWNSPIPQILSIMYYISYATSLIVLLSYYIFKKHKKVSTAGRS